MSCFSGRFTTGLFDNGCFQDGTNKNFISYNQYSPGSLSGDSCVGVVSFNTYGAALLGDQYVEVDSSLTYQFSVSVKTTQRSYNDRMGSGHLGFACYDQFKNFIDLRNCGGVGDTVLTRDLNPGDSFVYVNSISGWSTAATYASRHLMLFPATHPLYGTPHHYSRIGWGDFNICHAPTWTLTGSGDYQVQIQNTSNVNMTMPDIGYPTPAGTPVSVGQAGSTYNYALGAPIYPETWTTYTTPPFTGESRNSLYPFRYATKYVRFMNLSNYNYRTENSGDSARYLIDNVLLVVCPGGRSLGQDFFARQHPL